jgi:leader peptidase (prepilin peptidase)/N-methyltransferase
MNSAVLVVLAGLFGLLIGSFLNVVIWRLPRGESLNQPASHCPVCDHPIRPFDNIPVVSWLVLRRRCRDCGAPISARYPSVELVTAILFGVIAWRIGWRPALAGFLFFTAAGVALAMIDIDLKRLPNALTFPAYGVVLVSLVVDAATGGHWGSLLRAVAAMAVLYGFYFATMLLGEMVLKKKAMGFGDVKLAGLIGLVLGWLSWGALAVGAFGGFFVGAVGGVLLLVSGKGTLASKIPYGPYMLGGALIGILWGSQLADAYLRVSGV